MEKIRISNWGWLGYCTWNSEDPRKGKYFKIRTEYMEKWGFHCVSTICQKSRNIHCFSFTHDQRKSVFDHFLVGTNWDQRKVYFVNLMNKSDVKRKIIGGNENNRRTKTLQYYLTADGMKSKFVWLQKMLLLALCIKKPTGSLLMSVRWYVYKQRISWKTHIRWYGSKWTIFS